MTAKSPMSYVLLAASLSPAFMVTKSLLRTEVRFQRAVRKSRVRLGQWLTLRVQSLLKVCDKKKYLSPQDVISEFLSQRTARLQSTFELPKCRNAVSFILLLCSLRLLLSSSWLSPLRFQLSDSPNTAQLVTLQSLKSICQRGAPQQQADIRELSVIDSQFIEKLIWRSLRQLALRKKYCSPQSLMDVWCKSKTCSRVRQEESAMQRREFDVILRLPQRMRWVSLEKVGESARISRA